MYVCMADGRLLLLPAGAAGAVGGRLPGSLPRQPRGLKRDPMPALSKRLARSYYFFILNCRLRKPAHSVVQPPPSVLPRHPSSDTEVYSSESCLRVRAGSSE